jgi:lipid A 4'-phosphatase
MPASFFMHTTRPEIHAPDTTPALFFWMLAFSIAVALVPTFWMQLDTGSAAWFAGTAPRLESRAWRWVEWINLYVPAVFRGGIALALALWVVATWRKKSAQLRLALAFCVAAGILGPGAVVNWGFKDHWQRARPYQVQEFGGTQQFTRAGVITNQCDANCSFVSGHVACGFFFTSLMLVHRRRRVAWLVTGTAAGLVIGFSRMSAMGHWLSDVLWAYPVTLVSSWLVWKALVWAYNRGDTKPPATVG